MKCICIVAGIRDGLLLPTVLVRPQTSVQLPRSRRIFIVVAVPRSRLETRHFLLKRKEVPPSSHYSSQQVSAPAQRWISHVFHEVSTLQCIRVKVVKLRCLRWTGHSTQVRKATTYRTLLDKPLEELLLVNVKAKLSLCLLSTTP
jgi:hypothetical protein